MWILQILQINGRFLILLITVITPFASCNINEDAKNNFIEEAHRISRALFDGKTVFKETLQTQHKYDLCKKPGCKCNSNYNNQTTEVNCNCVKDGIHCQVILCYALYSRHT